MGPRARIPAVIQANRDPWPAHPERRPTLPARTGSVRAPLRRSAASRDPRCWAEGAHATLAHACMDRRMMSKDIFLHMPQSSPRSTKQPPTSSAPHAQRRRVFASSKSQLDEGCTRDLLHMPCKTHGMPTSLLHMEPPQDDSRCGMPAAACAAHTHQPRLEARREHRWRHRERNTNCIRSRRDEEYDRKPPACALYGQAS